MFWLKSIIITIQAARLVGLLGINDDVEDIIKNFNLGEICDYDTVSDFLSMDTEEFEERYDKNELYESGCRGRMYSVWWQKWENDYENEDERQQNKAFDLYYGICLAFVRL